MAGQAISLHPAATAEAAVGQGVIGPNAVTRLAEALESLCGRSTCYQVFAAAGAIGHLTNPPTAMVDEMDVARLHRVLHQVVGATEAERVSRLAGALTAAYLLKNRIPQLAQTLLRRLPKRLAAAILCRAIARHAWTFAGSGAFAFVLRPDPVLTIRHGPVCRLLSSCTPCCAYYTATFASVFSGVLNRPVHVREIACEALGAPACRFALAGC